MWRAPDSGVVEVARYICSLDGESVTGDVFLDEPDNPIAFEDLTEEMVIDWVKSSLKESSVENIEARVNELIALKNNPPQLDGLPWGVQAAAAPAE